MMRLGHTQELVAVKRFEHGMLLAEHMHDEKRVLLPKGQVPPDLMVGDSIRVFLYKDSEDRLIATTTQPPLEAGGYAPLVVTKVDRIGAWLDWGLAKDLLLPYHEMQGKPKAGDTILVRLYIDKSGRLAASMKDIYQLLQVDSPYEKGDAVSGRIYEFGHDFGTFVAVDDKYSAMIPRFEDVTGLRIGNVIKARVTNVKKDGKLDISIRRLSYEQMDEDAEALMALIDSYAGVLPFTEKASPEVIRRETGLSKNAFKRAIGHLYSAHRITLEGGKIRAAK